jgi:hypothetical protein
MKRNITFVVAVSFLLACSAVNSRASAVNRVQDPEQLGAIGWELSRDSFTRYEKVPVKTTGKVLLCNRETACILPRQSDLLKELLSADDVRNADMPEMITLR